jgi:penicillin amidase
VPETAGWALIQAKRPDTLPRGVASWQALLEQAILQSRDELAQKAGGDYRQARWGTLNEAHIQHPLAKAIPQLSAYLDMPVAPQSGDRHMPKVSGPAFGQSERMVVSPGHEEDGILVLPAGQSGHPLSEFYQANHQDWLGGQPTPFLPGKEKYQLILQPQG